MISRIVSWLIYLAALALPTQAVPLRILTIGDSLTEEYTFEALVFSANSKNWVELMAQHHPTELTFGTYKSSYFGYADLRNAGYRLNYGIPGNTTVDWVRIIGTSGKLGTDAKTRSNLETDLGQCDVAVIFLGGNDLKDRYDEVFNNTEPAGYLDAIVSNLARIHDWVRAKKPALKIVIATSPDIGATLNVSSTYNDPARQARTRRKIAAMNDAIRTMAVTKGAKIASVDKLTDLIFDLVPFHLNGTPLIATSTSSTNASNYVFCKDGFHPNTAGQALIANEIMLAITQATGRNLTTFPNREILTAILGLNADAPYTTWQASYPGLSGIAADDDLDGIPNLVEYTLGTSPQQRSQPLTILQSPVGALRFTPSTTGLRYAALTILESENLTTWQAVPDNRITVAPNGTWTIQPSGSTRGFYKLKAEVRP
jgi:lysophospholipase L1-like esterase